MSAGEEKAAPAAAQTTESTSGSSAVLDSILKATPRTIARDKATDMVKALVDSLTADVKVDKTAIKTISNLINKIDQKLSKQVAAILHHPDFQKLEGSWRGLHHLVMNSETCPTLKIKVLNVSKRDLFKDLDSAIEFDQSETFKRIYTDEFDMFGGVPYAAIVGDYEFTNHPEDIDLLSKMAEVSAGSFSPFLSAASPELMGLESYKDLAKPRDLSMIFESVEYTKWKSFRDSEDSRFVALTMPRVLSRLPYGENTKKVDEFKFEEVELDSQGRAKPVPHEHYAWMNSAYVLGSRLTGAFARTNWCTAIRGVENGGKVEGLPTHVFMSDDGDMDLKCPTEVGITTRRDAELAKLGFLPLCHFKNTDYSVFVTGQSTQKPKKYDDNSATENAAISARLPYIMAMSRITHYLKSYAHDKIGSFMEAGDLEKFLNRWIKMYVCNPDAGPDIKAQYPLADAKIEVKKIDGAPGAYNATVYLRPWLQLEELTASMRLVTEIPAKK